MNTNDIIDAIQTSENSEIYCNDYIFKIEEKIRGDTADKKNEYQRDQNN